MACLHKALEEKRYKYVTLNLNWGEDPLYQDEQGRTLLMKLSLFERDTRWSVTTARRLMNLPGARDMVDGDGRDILMYCVRNRKVGMAKLVLSEPDFDIGKTDKFGYRAIHYAAELGVEGIAGPLASVLVRFEMSVDVTTPTGMTPLMLACKAGHIDCARTLIKVGNASLTMKDNDNFKGPREWLAESYLVHDGMDPFAEGIALSKRCSSAKQPRRRAVTVSFTGIRRSRSENCLFSPRLSGPASARACTENPRDEYVSFCAITPARFIGRHNKSRYPLTPAIIFDDNAGVTVKAPRPSKDGKEESMDDSFAPFLYKLFTASSVQHSNSFRPPARKPRPPTPEPEPEPESSSHEEEEPEPEPIKKLAARIKLRKAMKLRRSEGGVNLLKKDTKKNVSGDKQNVRSVNINDIMANLKKKQTKSDLSSTETNSAALTVEKLKEKYGKFKKVTKQISTQPVKIRTSGGAKVADADVTINAAPVCSDKNLLKP